MENSGIEAYRVGFFDHLKHKKYKSMRSYLIRQIKTKNWKAVRNYFNGYLAEWHYPPEGVNHYKCGRGWTKRRAIKRLGIHLAESNLLER